MRSTSSAAPAAAARPRRQPSSVATASARPSRSRTSPTCRHIRSCTVGDRRRQSPRRPRRHRAAPAPVASRTAARAGSRIAVAARAPKTSPSSSELLASRLAPCTPVQATSPAAIQSRHRGAPRQVGGHAAHHVVRRRRHRNRGRGPGRDRARGRRPRSSGSGACTHAGVEVLERQVDRAAGPGLLAHDRARHQIARGQLAGRLVAGHEPLAVGVEQPRAFAAQRLGQQEARRAGHGDAPSDGTARTRDRRPRAPARQASAMPSPVATAGLVVSRKMRPAPPVASSVADGPHLGEPAVRGRSARRRRRRPRR